MELMSSYTTALVAILVFSVAAWAVSVIKKDVSIVDSLWSLFFIVAVVAYALAVEPIGLRGQIVLALTVIWALRLSVYITARNWGEGEDYRYRTIRANNEPNFALKSLYIVFGLQGLLAWIISIPLFVAVTAQNSIGIIDVVALALWTIGFIFEAGGDYQLSRFKAEPGNKGKVLDRGLWRYTRHPNYFGDACIWWSFYLFALSAGGWWTVYAPILMTLLLLKVSGVAMLEKTIGDRRPAYAEYIRNTNAFIPGLPGRRDAANSGSVS